MPGLEDLYREIILDHYRNPRNRGEFAHPPCHRTECYNPLCGDEIVVFLDVHDGTVVDREDRRTGVLHQPVVGLDDVVGVKGRTWTSPRPHPRLQGG